MRALAEFVMRGRTQAIAVATLAVASQFLVLIGVAIVGLVTLRRGPSNGLVILAWTLLPALAVALFGSDIGPALALIGATLAAQVLRSTQSWPLALLVAVGIGLLTAVLFQTVAHGYVEQWSTMFNQLVDRLSQGAADGSAATNSADKGGVQFQRLSAAQISGVLGWGTVSSITAGLLLARWWQAKLYNPGGFRSEFHQLRLPLPIAAALLVCGLGVTAIGPDYEYWSWLFAVPLFVAGLALVHGAIGIKKLGRGVLIAVYVALLLIGWMKLVLLLLALLDSGWNFRARLVSRTPSK